MEKKYICKHNWIVVEWREQEQKKTGNDWNWEDSSFSYTHGIRSRLVATMLYCPNCETYKELK